MTSLKDKSNSKKLNEKTIDKRTHREEETLRYGKSWLSGEGNTMESEDC